LSHLPLGASGAYSGAPGRSLQQVVKEDDVEHDLQIASCEIR
jgi:hypothetical protein